MNIKEAIEVVKHQVLFNASLPTTAKNSEFIIPMLWSEPGMGKTQGVGELCEEMDWDFRPLSIAQYDAGELGGYLVVDKENEQCVRYAPFFMKGFDPKKITVLFLDELPQSPLANLNIAAQLIDERRIGEHALPANVFIVCAGNPVSARAGANQLPGQLKDRLNHLHIQADQKAFEEYAIKNNIHFSITSFLRARPEWLSKYSFDKPSPSPRSWFRVSSLVKSDIPEELLREVIQGQVGDAAIADYYTFLREFEHLPDVENEVFADPENTMIPTTPDLMYALCDNMAYKVTDKTAKAFTTYIRRFENMEYAGFAMRSALDRHPELKKSVEMATWCAKEGKELLLPIAA